MEDAQPREGKGRRDLGCREWDLSRLQCPDQEQELQAAAAAPGLLVGTKAITATLRSGDTRVGLSPLAWSWVWEQSVELRDGTRTGGQQGGGSCATLELGTGGMVAPLEFWAGSRQGLTAVAFSRSVEAPAREQEQVRKHPWIYERLFGVVPSSSRFKAWEEPFLC